MMSPTHLKPREVAERLQMGYGMILRHIRSGALEAVDVSCGPGRPEWRVPLAAIERFLDARSNAQRQLAQVRELPPRGRSNSSYRDAA